MSNGPWRIKPREISRAIKAARSTGAPVRSVEIAPDGMVRVNFGEPESVAGEEKTKPGEWD
jgi:hypothetical protein